MTEEIVADAKILDERRVERFLPYFRSYAICIVVIGLASAYFTGVAYWIDRSGKVLVASSLFLTYLQFRYEHQFSSRSKKSVKRATALALERGILEAEARRIVSGAETTLRERFDEVRRKVLMDALVFAAIGELVAAFGGVLFAEVRRIAGV